VHSIRVARRRLFVFLGSGDCSLRGGSPLESSEGPIMLTQESANRVRTREGKPSRGTSDVSQVRLSLDEWEAIWLRCWRRIRSWRIPPRWNRLDWWDEARAEAALAACATALDYDPTPRRPSRRLPLLSTHPGQRLDQLSPGMGLRPPSPRPAPRRGSVRPGRSHLPRRGPGGSRPAPGPARRA